MRSRHGEMEANGLNARLTEQTIRAEALEAQNATLRSTAAQADQARSGTAPKTASLRREALEERIRAARERVKHGPPAEALRELLWGLDEGLAQSDTATEPAKRSLLMSSFRDLAEVYPPAREELQRRRKAVRSRILANAGGADFVAEYAGIVRALQEPAALLSLFDEVPAGDRRRTILAIYASEQLIDARRYAEAMEGMSAGAMFSAFETKARRGSALQARGGAEGEVSSLATSTAKDIELLAGSGDVANARELARRLLAVDPSENTKALVQKHAARAGQPDLLSTTPP